MKIVTMKAEQWKAVSIFLGSLKGENNDEVRNFVRVIDRIDAINKDYLSVEKPLDDRKQAEVLKAARKYRKAVYDNGANDKDAEQLWQISHAYIMSDMFYDDDQNLKAFGEKDIEGVMDDADLTFLKTKMDAQGPVQFTDKKMYVDLSNAVNGAKEKIE